ncbi:MAG: hypothetical protein JNL75_11185 [Chitinophagales bacterium]|nr:hypothetical protein [Chitinophagales bacterium]
MTFINYQEFEDRIEVYPSRLLVNIDWLSFSCLYDWEKSPFYNTTGTFETTRTVFNPRTELVEQTKLVFVETKGNSKHFRRIYSIEFDSVKLADIEVEHNGNAAFSQNHCRVKMNNFWFYNKGLRNYIRLILAHLNIQSYKLSRIDICGDNFIELKQVLEGIYTNKYGFQFQYHKGVGRKFNSYVYNYETEGFESYAIGSESTGLRFSFYEKMQELKIKKNKDYILEYFEINKILFEKVYRFEIRLTKDKLKQYFLNNSTEYVQFTETDLQGNTIYHRKPFNSERNTYSKDTGEIIEISNHLLSPDFLNYCKLLYFQIINEDLKFLYLPRTDNEKPIEFIFNQNFKIEKHKWTKEANYRFEKQIYTYYIYQYLDNEILDNYNYQYFANAVVQWHPYNWYYLERKFVEIVPSFYFKSKKIKPLKHDERDITLKINEIRKTKRQKIIEIHDFLMELMHKLNEQNGTSLIPKLMSEKKRIRYFTHS